MKIDITSYIDLKYYVKPDRGHKFWDGTEWAFYINPKTTNHFNLKCIAYDEFTGEETEYYFNCDYDLADAACMHYSFFHTIQEYFRNNPAEFSTFKLKCIQAIVSYHKPIIKKINDLEVMMDELLEQHEK